MAEAATKLPVKTETSPAPQQPKVADWRPFDTLRNQVDRLFRGRVTVAAHRERQHVGYATEEGTIELYWSALLTKEPGG